MSLTDLPSYIQSIIDRIIDDSGFCDYTVEIKQGSQTGDGFLSELSSITIIDKTSDKQLDLVCKIAPLNKNRRKEFFSNVVFDRESIFYNKLMPTFIKFQNDKNVPDCDQFRSCPKCYAAIADDENEQYVIVMEDLRPQGFKMWNKAKAVPIENMRLAMQELGKFHGISIAMKDQCAEDFEPFRQLKDISQTFFQSENMQGMFDASFDRAIKALKNDQHKDIIRELQKDTLSHFKYCLNEDVSNRFGVISHGNFKSLTYFSSF